MRMKILYDHQIFSLQRYGGISRYFFELMSAYSKNSNLSYELGLKYSENAYLKNSKQFSDIEGMESTKDFFKKFDFKGSKYVHSILTQIGLANEGKVVNRKTSLEFLQKKNFDVFHPTYYDDYFLKYLSNKPFVLTVYDMIHEKNEGIYFNKNDEVLKNKKLLAQRASKIISISKSTKNDLVEIYGIDEDKIEVIHLGSSLLLDKKRKGLYSFPPRYILFVGDRHLYKNFIFFVKSVSPLLKKDKDLFIVCIGSKPFDEQEITLLKKLEIEKRVVHKPMEDDNMLAHSYANALCFVFPTLYEGFGIPILEAFSCDCPAVLSNTSSLPEVAGNAAIFFNPEEENSLKDSIENLIYNEKLREELKIKGRKRLKNFSWEKCALETQKIYEKVSS
jgi:glycosyltransferase involved in cell wall biosynthesis